MQIVVLKLQGFTKWDLQFIQQDYNFNESIETEKRKATCSKYYDGLFENQIMTSFVTGVRTVNGLNVCSIKIPVTNSERNPLPLKNIPHIR